MRNLKIQNFYIKRFKKEGKKAKVNNNLISFSILKEKIDPRSNAKLLLKQHNLHK